MKAILHKGLLAVAAGAMLVSSAVMAQQGPPRGGPPGGPGAGMAMGGQLDRAGTIQRFGLADAALKLSDAQKKQVDTAADAYVAEMKAVNEKYPMAAGSPPGQEGMDARNKARENLTAAVHKALDAEQRKTWDAAQAARRGPGMGGGMGGPGGPGGPGGMGPGGPRPQGGPGGAGGARPQGQ